MTTSYKLRPETEADKPRIATLLARTYLGEGVKAIELASELRQQTDYDADLALVAEANGEAVACAMFTPVSVDGIAKKALVLASMGVDTRNPELDVQAFLEQAMQAAKQHGHRFILMRGDAKEFGESGFVKTQDLGLSFGKNDTGDWLVKDMDPAAGDIELTGAVVLPDYLK